MWGTGLRSVTALSTAKSDRTQKIPQMRISVVSKPHQHLLRPKMHPYSKYRWLSAVQRIKQPAQHTQGSVHPIQATAKPSPYHFRIVTARMHLDNRSHNRRRSFDLRRQTLKIVQSAPIVTGKTVRQGAERGLATTTTPALNTHAARRFAAIRAVTLNPAPERIASLQATRRCCTAPGFLFNILGSGQFSFMSMLHWSLTARRWCARATFFMMDQSLQTRRDGADKNAPAANRFPQCRKWS